MPNVLTIAGTDPSGGAGIQADLKTFSALGAYGMSAVTAVVAQNTRGVQDVLVLEPEFVAAQIRSVIDDVRVDAIKLGMLATAPIAAAVADVLAEIPEVPLVIDPVMVAKSGDRLISDETVAVVRDRLVPRAALITPNLPEAAVLLGAAPDLGAWAVADGADADRAPVRAGTGTPATGPAEAEAADGSAGGTGGTAREADSLARMREQVPDLLALGSAWVLLKGGHLVGETSVDLLAGAAAADDAVLELPARRIATRNTHGTGCTLSAAVAALLPRHGMVEAVRQAKDYLTGALAHADELAVGGGHGPVHHFHALWDRPAPRP
ncbi:phosphomethylpyrimidine kinase [Brachybacterium phenoliresistens]|uniref:Phosphomethylpyrimidine kinase n=1 Tax=Brachybacterium phenoliresistens TaxID=396014 RepID=Z9JRX5_9MICO|nr:phosphomethylpyrimidine kinase [Brachybacterium phenoliresistens]